MVIQRKAPSILGGIFLTILTLFMPLNAQWAKIYRGDADRHGAKSIQQTRDGGYIIAGYIDYRSGEPYWWILKLSEKGDIEWQKTIVTNDKPESIQETSDGGFIIAGWEGPRWVSSFRFRVIKLDSDRNIEWNHEYGTGIDEHCQVYSIQQTSDGGYVVAGYLGLESSRLFRDVFVLKLFSNGEIEWQKTYGGSDEEEASSIQQTNDGGYIVAGYTRSFGNGERDFWILKLSSNGYTEWQKTYGGAEDDYAHSIQQTSDGGSIVTGGTKSFDSEEWDIWILKLSSTGEAEWQKRYGSSADEVGSSIQQTSDGGYIIIGSHEYQYFDSEEIDVLILKLSQYGIIEWHYYFGGSNNDYANDIQQTTDGGYVVAGSTRSFGETEQDILVLKLSPGGVKHSSCLEYESSSDASISNTYITPQDSNISSQDTNITPRVDSWIIEGSVETTVTVLCGEKEGGGEGNDRLFELPCFIATAAYSSPLHPCVQTLRDFRDRYLMSNGLGRKLVNFYYKYSPFVANMIAKHKVLKVLVRINLLPLVVFSYSMVHFGPVVTGVIIAFIFMLPAFLASFLRRKLRQIR